jgi:aminoglycoside 3-N-acetyltransferase
VGHDDDTHFPVVGREFGALVGIEPVLVGGARVALLPVRALVTFAMRRLGRLLSEPR